MLMPIIKSREIIVQQLIPISKTLKFWEGLKEGIIFATRCESCGQTHFPPASDCSNCLLSKMSWVELGGEAEIETFTHVVARPISFQPYKPYTVAIGKIEEGVKVFAWLKGFKLSEVKVGMKVKLVAGTDEEGRPTFMFVPLT